MVKLLKIPIPREDPMPDLDGVIGRIVDELKLEKMKRSVEKIFKNSDVAATSVATAVSVFAKELPIRFDKAERIRNSIKWNSRYGAYGLPYDVMEYLFQRRSAIAELFGAPISVIADVRFRFDIAPDSLTQFFGGRDVQTTDS